MQTSEDRAATALGFHPRVMIAVIAFSFFIDYFLYGLLFPLAAHSAAKLESEGQFALLYGAYGASVLFVTPLFGYLGDRIGGRATMLCGVALELLAVTLFGAASSFPVLLVAKFCQGSASAALWTSGLALIATHYPENRVAMFGYGFTGGTIGSVLGPIAGGFLYHLGGYRLPFLVLGISTVVEAALIAFLVPAGGSTSGRTHGYRALLLNRSVIKSAVVVALAAFSVGLLEPLLPVRLARFGTTSVSIGIIFTVSALVYGLSAPLVGHLSERMPVQKVIVLGTVAMAAMLPLLAAFKEVILVGIVMSLANISYALMLNPASAELGNAVERSGMSCYSAVYAVYNIFYSIGMLATALLASAAARVLGFWGVLLCASAILLLSIPLLTMADMPRRAVVTASTD